MDSGYSIFSQSVVDDSVSTYMSQDQLPPAFVRSEPYGFARLDDDQLLVYGFDFDPYTFVVNLATRQYTAAPNRTTDHLSLPISITGSS